MLSDPPTPARRSFSLKRFLLRASIVFLIALVALLIWSVRSGTETFSSPDPRAETKEVVVKLNRVMLVPNETPFIARIANADELKRGQFFYRDAKNGHYLIIYNSISRAIIFDAAAGRIINIGPVVPRDELSSAENALLAEPQ